jgi:hypothetical protein
MTAIFDPDVANRRLEPLSAPHWIAFGTSCAQRLIAIFRLGEQAWDWHGRTGRFQNILDDCWSLALSPTDVSSRDRLLASDWESLFREGDHTDTRGYRLFAFRPLATLELAIDCAVDQTVERAARAAKKEYDTMTGIGEWGLAFSTDWSEMSPDEVRRAGARREENIHADAIVQECLRAQLEALDSLALGSSVDEQFVKNFRLRAISIAEEYATNAAAIMPRTEHR